MDLLELMPSVESVVEAGCSSGALAAAYRQRCPGCRYLGIEIDPEYAVLARKHCDQVLVADLDALSHCPVSRQLMAECWVFGDCLEHLVDPWRVLRWVRQHQPGHGVICACLPNAQHWSLQARLSCGDWEYQDSGLLDRTHLRFFTAKTIPQAFSRAGYKLEALIPRYWGKKPTESIVAAIAEMAGAAGGNSDVAVQSSMPSQYLVLAKKQ